MKKIGSIIWKEFIYGGHLQCLGVVGIVYSSTYLLNVTLEWVLFVVPYLLFYLIYINDRLKGIVIDEKTNKERTEHLKKCLSFLPLIVLLVFFAISLILIYVSSISFLIFVFTLLFFGILYPFYFKKLTTKIIAFKNIYVASFFSITTLFPVFYYHLSISKELVLLLTIFTIFVFIKTILMQISLDHKDVIADKEIGLKTVPIIIGKERSVYFLKLANIFLAFILMLAVFYLEYLPVEFLIFIIGIPFVFWGYQLIEKKNYFGYIITSSEFSLWIILIAIIDLIQ
ncbi:MAG: UbiA family prenyltransferase [Patescibacteria group bacterium]|nr:UbiA family prenyltransferase [Patescibacteria group bacterium]